MTTLKSTRLPGPERRATILDAARAEFESNGFAGARIDDIARTAGVTNAIIYRHFASKEELYEAAIMAPLHDVLRRRVEEIRQLPADVEGRAQQTSGRVMMRDLVVMFSESIGSFGVVLFGDPERARVFYTTHVRPLIDATIEAGKDNLARWPHRDYNVEIAVQAMFAMAFWFSLDRMTRQGDDDLLERADQAIDLILNGINPRGDEA